MTVDDGTSGWPPFAVRLLRGLTFENGVLASQLGTTRARRTDTGVVDRRIVASSFHRTSGVNRVGQLGLHAGRKVKVAVGDRRTTGHQNSLVTHNPRERKRKAPLPRRLSARESETEETGTRNVGGGAPWTPSPPPPPPPHGRDRCPKVWATDTRAFGARPGRSGGRGAD